MNLQDIITYRENQGNESEFNSNIKENNAKILNKDDKDNSSNYSYTRSNMIEKEIENNLESKNNNIDINKNNQENNQNNLNENDNKEKNESNDIIDELIEKIKNKKELGIKKDIPKLNFSELDEELKLGLKQLNKIQTQFNNRPILNTSKILQGNRKYKEVIFEISKSLNSVKSKTPHSRTGSYFSFKNIKIIKPTIYFLEKPKKTKIYKYIPKKDNQFYLSSIDGKAIINGERKNPEEKLGNLLKNKNNPANKRKVFSTDRERRRRSYSTYKRSVEEENKYFPDFGNRKIHYYGKNYFFEELNRINNLLFS